MLNIKTDNIKNIVAFLANTDVSPMYCVSKVTSDTEQPPCDRVI